MLKLFAVSLLLANLSVISFAQSLTHQTSHMTATADIIDGAKTPNLIPDVTAWRLWLIAVTAEDSSKPQLSEQRQRSFLKKAGIGDTEMPVALEVLAQFKTDYPALIANYNQHPSDSALPAFLVQRDALVQSVQAALTGKLDVFTAARLEQHIQAEKAHMKVAKEEQ